MTKRLFALPRGAFCVLNAACRRDLDVFVAGLLAAEPAGRRFLFRTAADFVAARLAMEPRLMASLGEAEVEQRTQDRREPGTPGGLTVLGSHVPKTTAQLERLLSGAALEAVGLKGDAVLDLSRRNKAIAEASNRTYAALEAGRDVVLFTSRKVCSSPDPAQALDLGRQVSDALVSVVRQLPLRPRLLIAKGGITSSDLATRARSVAP